MSTDHQLPPLIDTLANEPPGTIVRVLVRALEPSGPERGSAVLHLNPRDYKSAIEYRSALIAQQKQRVQPGKEALVARARDLGLNASAAGSINAVLVQGEVGRVIRLLEQAPIESASLEKPLAGL